MRRHDGRFENCGIACEAVLQTDSHPAHGGARVYSLPDAAFDWFPLRWGKPRATRWIMLIDLLVRALRC